MSISPRAKGGIVARTILGYRVIGIRRPPARPQMAGGPLVPPMLEVKIPLKVQTSIFVGLSRLSL
jgi:hypothetical protein